MLFENLYCKVKPPKKKAKFAIAINPQGRMGYYVKKLKYFLKETYPFLVEECALFREKSLKAAKPGDRIVFGCGKKYDYTVMTPYSYDEDPAIPDELTEIDLETGFKLIKKAVKRYVQKNYPDKVLTKLCEQQFPCGVYNQPQAKVLECTAYPTTRRTTRLTVVPCAPKKVYKKRTLDWNVQVNNRYVLLTNGSSYKTVNITRCGNREIVVIGGTRYNIRRDCYGKGILVR